MEGSGSLLLSFYRDLIELFFLLSDCVGRAIEHLAD